MSLFEFEDFEEPPDPDDYPNDYEWHYRLWALHYPEIAAASEKWANMVGEPPQQKETSESTKSIIYPSPLRSPKSREKESTKTCDPTFASRYEAFLQETEPLPIGYWILYWCGQKAIHDAIRAEFTSPLVLYFVPQSKRRGRRRNNSIDKSTNFLLDCLDKECGDSHHQLTKLLWGKHTPSSNYYAFDPSLTDKRSPAIFYGRGPPATAELKITNKKVQISGAFREPKRRKS